VNGTKAFLAGAIVIALSALIFLAVGSLGDNLVYYWTPSELQAAGDKALDADIRLGGMVKGGSVNWDDKTTALSFTVFDGAHEVPVQGKGLPPQMFRENIGVVVEGKWTGDGVFHSTRVLVKHDNQYRAPEDGEAPDMEAMMKTMQGES
jgi:cytochrome c-type biogenesis protein CcmE